jgi:hypothetical protein
MRRPVEPVMVHDTASTDMAEELTLERPKVDVRRRRPSELQNLQQR